MYPPYTPFSGSLGGVTVTLTLFELWAGTLTLLELKETPASDVQ